MRIANVKVENFRSLLSVEMPVSDITALVGRNGAGKSAILRALSLFYTPSAQVTTQDCYGHCTDSAIVVEVRWDSLTEQEKARFGCYMDGPTLTVRKEVRLTNGKPSETYRASQLQYERFIPIRKETKDSARRSMFNDLVESADVPGLSVKAPSGPRALAMMEEWEQAHQADCVQSPVAVEFFGPPNIGTGRLNDFTKFVYVQAVRDASDDAVEGRSKGPLSELLDVLVRSVLLKDEELRKFRTQVAEEYSRVFSPDRLPELPKLAAELTKVLQQYAANAGVSLLWADAAGPEIQLPTALAELEEDGFRGPVSRKGHGLQRAFILSLLQFLASLRREGASKEVDAEAEEGDAPEPILPSLVLAIEEPELYQHPGRQRRLARAFRDLAGDSPEGVSCVQVIFSTHSPLFVDVGHFEEVRLVRKEPNHDTKEAPMVSTVAHTSEEYVREVLDKAGKGQPKRTQPGALEARLATVMTPSVGEGFFADAVVLVEGDSDQAAILGAAAASECDLDQYGVSVVPVGGKTKLDKPLAVFGSLGIPCYAVFDGDRHRQDRQDKGNPEANEKLLRLVGAEPAMWPDSQVTDTFACFEENLERQLCADWGPTDYQEIMEEARECYGYCGNDDACKNPAVMAHALQLARERNCDCSRLLDIVARAVRRSSMYDA